MFLISLNAEIVACILSFRKSKIAPQAKSAKYFQIWFFPRFGGKKWRRSEHAHASYPGLEDSSFAHPGSAPIWGGKKGEFRDWTTSPLAKIKTMVKLLWPLLIIN